MTPAGGNGLSWERVSGRDDPRQRFRIYRLCTCSLCDGTRYVDGSRCPDCRGEGKTRELLATAGTPEAVGVAIVQLGREQEFEDCPLGLLDTQPPCETCGGYGEDLNPFEGVTVPCRKCSGSGIKPTGSWLIRPWLASPRNQSDAGRVLASARKKERR